MFQYKVFSRLCCKSEADASDYNEVLNTVLEQYQNIN